jgi:hypothetical protein
MAALEWGSILLCDDVTMVGLRVKEDWKGELTWATSTKLASRDDMEFRSFVETNTKKFFELFFMAAVEGIKRRRLDAIQ